jgi:hypothetical protein
MRTGYCNFFCPLPIRWESSIHGNQLKIKHICLLNSASTPLFWSAKYYQIRCQISLPAALHAKTARFHPTVVREQPFARSLPGCRRESIVKWPASTEGKMKISPQTFFNFCADHVPLLRVLREQEAEVSEADVRRLIRSTAIFATHRWSSALSGQQSICQRQS